MWPTRASIGDGRPGPRPTPDGALGLGKHCDRGDRAGPAEVMGEPRARVLDLHPSRASEELVVDVASQDMQSPSPTGW